jgi:hypothetical protein
LEKNMSKISSLLIVFMLSAFALAQNDAPGPGAAGQQQPATTTPQAGQLQPGSLIYAELSKSIDSKKAKVGDPVVGKVTQAVLSHGKIVIPKNTRIIGRLTAAKAHTKDQPQSELGIAFDRAELKDGTQVPLTSVTMQAVAGPPGLDQSPSNIASGAGGSEAAGMPSSRPGGQMGGMSSPMHGSSYPSPSNPGAAGDVNSGSGTGPLTGSGRLNAGSRGVIGMSGVRLEPQAQGGVVAQDGKNVKLDSGTQLVLRTQ